MLTNELLMAVADSLEDLAKKIRALSAPVLAPTSVEEAHAADTPRPSYKQWQETQPAPKLEVPPASVPKPPTPRPPVMRRASPP